jgi:hypothetical protein
MWRPRLGSSPEIENRNKPIDTMGFTPNYIHDASLCVPIRLFPLFHSCHRLTTQQLLFVFVTVLAQSFFTLVRSHLVAFAFFSVWHVINYL